MTLDCGCVVTNGKLEVPCAKHWPVADRCLKCDGRRTVIAKEFSDPPMPGEMKEIECDRCGGTGHEPA